MACAPHLHSLNRVFDSRSMGSQGSNETNTLIRRCMHMSTYTILNTSANSDGNVKVMNTERSIAEKISKSFIFLNCMFVRVSLRLKQCCLYEIFTTEMLELHSL